MSFFLGAKGAKVKPQFTGLGVQTSTSSLPVPICLGQNRLAGNIFWQGDFKAVKKKQKVGKGGAQSQTTYEYTGSYQIGLCYGPITDVPKMWKDQDKTVSYQGLGFTLFAGDPDQAPWGYLTTNHPDEALGYPHIAHLSVANYNLGTSNTLPQHSFEVKAPLWGTQVGGTGDADVALCVDYLVNNPLYGIVGGDINTITMTNLLSTPEAGTTGDSTFQTYCQAMGFGLSPFLTGQEQGGVVLQRWADLCNTALVWTGFTLKFIPRSSEEVIGGGSHHYVPDVPVRYTLTDKDFIRQDGEDPITFDRIDPADAKNSITLDVRARGNEYNPVPATWIDSGLVDQYGIKPQDSISAEEVCEPETGRRMAALMGQRIAYTRNTYYFRLGAQYCLIEPMDILECVDPRWGSFLVRVEDVEEDDNDELSITAKEYSGSIGSSGPVAEIPTENNPIDTGVLPGPINPPIIFEPPASLSGGSQVWAAVSGGDGTDYDPDWGGCYVWISTDDITYDQIGTITTPARQGKLTSILPTFALPNPDAANTLEITLAMSGGELSDTASAYDAEQGVTICYVDGELISFEDATLTGALAYDLGDDLWRGLHGSTIGAHALGSDFARLDDNIFKYEVPAAYVGVPLYLKFQSFNIFQNAVEDLDTVVAYNYTPNGAGFGTGPGGAPSAPTGVTTTPGYNLVSLSWNANSENDLVTAYEIWRAPGLGADFVDAIKVATVGGDTLSFTDVSAAPKTDYTYFIVAVNLVGSGPESAGIDVTSGSLNSLIQSYITNPPSGGGGSGSGGGGGSGGSIGYGGGGTGTEVTVTEYATVTKIRFRILAPGSDGINAGFSDIELYGTDWTHIFVGVGYGTASASSSAAGTSPDEAFDGDHYAGNEWKMNPASESVIGSWLQFEFTTPCVPERLGIDPIQLGGYVQSPEAFIAEHWDGTAWVSLGSFTAVWEQNEKKIFYLVPVTTVTSYAATESWRITTITPGTNGSAAIGEVTFMGTSGAIIPNLGTASASSTAGGYSADDAFDSDSSIGWKANVAAASWLQFTFTIAPTVRTVMLQPIFGDFASMPQEFSIDFFDGSTWQSVYTTPAPIVWSNDSDVFTLGSAPPGTEPTPSPAADAPADGDLYGRQLGAWVPVPDPDIQDLLDQISSTQGHVLYRNATDWVSLAPGTANSLLKTGGAAANPSWSSLTALLDLLSSTQGSILYRNAAGWVALAPGASGDVLTSAGGGANPSWVTPAAQPFGFAFNKPNPVASKIVTSFDTPIAWTIPTSLTDSQCSIIDSDTAVAAGPSAQTDFDLQSPPGSSIGTIRFAIAAVTATFIKASPTAVSLGDITQVVAPANLNGITGTLTGSIKGTR